MEGPGGRWPLYRGSYTQVVCSSSSVLTLPCACSDSFVYRLAYEPSYTPNHISAIALVKRIDVLDPEVPLTQQLNLMSLFGPASVSDGPDVREEADGRDGEEANGKTVAAVHESPYEALYSVMHNVMVPWFDAYVTSKASDKQVTAGSRADTDNKGESACV
jgi:dynein heavy chain 1